MGCCGQVGVHRLVLLGGGDQLGLHLLFHGLHEEAAFNLRIAVCHLMLLAVLPLHEHMAPCALDQWIVTGLNRVQVQLHTSRLGRQVLALAKLVGNFILVVARRLVEVTVELERALADGLGLLDEDDLALVIADHMLLQRCHIFKSDRREAIGAPRHEVTLQLRHRVLLDTLVLRNDVVQELQLIITAAGSLLLLLLLP